MTGTVPPERADSPTVASCTWQMIADEPYRYTSGDVIFAVFAERAGIAPNDRPGAREQYYSVGRACLRSSDLGKRSGCDVHADAEGRVADYAAGSREYGALAAGATPDGEPMALTRAMHPFVPGRGSAMHPFAPGRGSAMHLFVPGRGSALHLFAPERGSAMHLFVLGRGSAMHLFAPRWVGKCPTWVRMNS